MTEAQATELLTKVGKLTEQVDALGRVSSHLLNVTIALFLAVCVLIFFARLPRR